MIVTKTKMKSPIVMYRAQGVFVFGFIRLCLLYRKCAKMQEQIAKTHAISRQGDKYLLAISLVNHPAARVLCL